MWRGGGQAIRKDMRPPDGRWAGNDPQLVVDLRGPTAAAAIPKIEAAIAAYPYPDSYVTWPGPNSNSFIAYIVRTVPELNAQMPANASARTSCRTRSCAAMAPSGTGIQVSLAGLLGFTVALDEGVEVNFLGLVLGIDPMHLGGQAAGPRPGRRALMRPRAALARSHEDS